MTAEQQKAQVLIVGSGPSGLVAALCLLKQGISVRIIEKDPEHHNGERGAGVQPRTVELEHFLGADDVFEQGDYGQAKYHTMDPKDPHRIARTHDFIDEIEPTPSMPITLGTIISQADHQAILRKHIEELGGKVELGCALTGLEEVEGGVKARLQKTVGGETSEETATFAFVIGADGARSIVRKHLKVEFFGRSHEDMTAYLVDAFLEGFTQKGFTSFGDRDKDMVIFRSTGTEKFYAMMILIKDQNFERFYPVENNLNRVQSEITRITRRHDIRVTSIRWQNAWRANVRMASKFHEGRIFLVGDAAHTHPHTGGQGLNGSIQDSFNLSWKLSLVLKGFAKPELLESYDTERQPVIAEMLNLTTDIYKQNMSSRVAKVISEMTGPKEAGLTRGRICFQLDINYRWSDIVFDERYTSGVTERHAYGGAGDQYIRAGDRAPDAPALECLYTTAKPVNRLFDIFNPAKHIALVFRGTIPGDANPFATSLSAFPDQTLLKVLIIPSGSSVESYETTSFEYVLRDTENHAHQGYGVDQATPAVVIVRPDAHIGAFCTSTAGVGNYISRVF